MSPLAKNFKEGRENNEKITIDKIMDKLFGEFIKFQI